MQVMVFNAQSTRFGPLSLFVLSIVRGTALVLTFLGAKRVTPTVCSAPEYHQFDFWLGDWDSFEFSRSTRDAHVRINRGRLRPRRRSKRRWSQRRELQHLRCFTKSVAP